MSPQRLPVPRARRVFSRLRVLSSQTVPMDGGFLGVICRCLCGQPVLVSLSDLWHGRRQSCGCLHSDNGRQTIARARAARAQKRAADPAASHWCGSCGAGFTSTASLGRHYQRQHRKRMAG
jgi:hypothetical protein